MKLRIDADRANLASVTNLDVASASASGINGARVAVLREGDKQIPVIARLRMDERARLSDVENLYVYAAQGPQKIPLRQVSNVSCAMETEKLRRRNQFRTLVVGCFTTPGALSSEMINDALPRLEEMKRSLPPGYSLEVEGEYKEQKKGFKELGVVM